MAHLWAGGGDKVRPLLWGSFKFALVPDTMKAAKFHEYQDLPGKKQP
jgi:hypothetical protein